MVPRRLANKPWSMHVHSLLLFLLFSPLVHGQATSLFRPIAYAGSAILSDACLYLYGGATTVAATNIGSSQFLRLDLTQTFNTTTAPWTSLPGFLIYTQIDAAPSKDGRQFILGGNRDNFGPLSYIYNIGTQDWTRAPDLPPLQGKMDQYKRTNIGMALDPYTGLVYMVGGYQYFGFSSEVSVMDTSNPNVAVKFPWTFSQNMTQMPGLYDPVALYLPTLKKIAVFAGCNYFNPDTGVVGACARMDDVYLLSGGGSGQPLLIEQKMTNVGPTPRYQLCAVVMKDGNIFIQGGKDMSKVFNEAWILNVGNWTWSPVNINGPASALTRTGHTCQMGPNGQIIVLGGVDNNSSFVAPYVAVIDSTTWTWTTQYKGAPPDSIWTIPSSGGDGSKNGTTGGGTSSEGLSSGAKGGIAAGVVIGVLALALGVFFWRRRQQQQQQQSTGNSGDHAEHKPVTSLEKNNTTNLNNGSDANRLVSDTSNGSEQPSRTGPGVSPTQQSMMPIPMTQAQMTAAHLVPSHLGPVHMVPAHMIPAHMIPAYQLAGQQAMVPVSHSAMVAQHPVGSVSHLTPASQQALGSMPAMFQGQMYTTNYQGAQDAIVPNSTMAPNAMSFGAITPMPVYSGDVAGRTNLIPVPPQTHGPNLGYILPPSSPSLQGSTPAGNDSARAASLMQAEDQVPSTRSPTQPSSAASSAGFIQPITPQHQHHILHATHIPPTIQPIDRSKEGIVILEEKPTGAASLAPSSSPSSTTPSIPPRPTAVAKMELATTPVNNTDRTVLPRSTLPGPQSVPEHEARIERFSPGVKSHMMGTRDLDQNGFLPPLTPTRMDSSHSIVVGVPVAGRNSSAFSFSAALPKLSPTHRDMEYAASMGGGEYFGPATPGDSTASSSNCNSASSLFGREREREREREQDRILSSTLSKLASQQQQPPPSPPYRDPRMMKDLENITKLIEVQTQSEIKNPHTVVKTP
ncbi:hypothetical protein B0O80DRAFT_447200 [Mortierella sp. GBAus27b]|nr:hypothetical protein BGX31_011528 [Mortierella sp. GBA43]KAI8356332.1 hypothetical protein B0O80DRAFT_447200 [Mortierella sp. GBAus27b]